jgi:hypothetical protein
MDTMEIENSILSLRKYIDDVESDIKIPDIMFRRSLNETWFSDTLAWLFDPKSGDSLGVKFLEKFIEIIAKKRSSLALGYKQKKSHLKFGKSGIGRTVTGVKRFSFKNAAVCREFYLSKKVRNNSEWDGSGPKYCDVVVLDLDSSDGIFLAVENKLFTTNHPNQLESYYYIIEDKYSRVKTREYVYLTILGERPQTNFHESDKKVLETEWVCISWVDDILPILEDLKPENNAEVEDVRRLRKLLKWLKRITQVDAHTKEDLENFVQFLVDSTAECLVEELNRLTKKGHWSQKTNIKSSVVHSSYPTKILRIQMLPNLFVTVHGQKNSKLNYEKVLIPFGAFPDQVFHLIDISARDVCYNHFTEPLSYMSGNRKQTVTVSDTKQKFKPVLDFLFEKKYQLQVLIYFSKKIRKAEKEELEDEYSTEGN